jgi:ATP-dependent Lon protease
MLTNTKLPVLITRGLIVFPTTSKDIEVGREISINAVNWASGENNELLIVSQINPNIERPSTDELFKCGTLCTITNKKEANDGGYTITVKGNKRVNLTDIKLEKKENSYSASYSVIKETNANNSANEEKMKLIMENYENISAINNDKKKMLFKELFSGKMNGAKISDGIGNILTISLDEMQTLLEEKDITKRLDKIILFLIPNHEKEKIDGDITKKINETLSKQQKEFYLREKMKVVKEELGRINENENELSSIKNKIETKPYPEYIKNKVKDELKRIEGHGSHMQEAAITKSYLD